MTDVTFDLNCAYCGGPVTLQMANWPAALRFDGSPMHPDDIHHTLALAVPVVPERELSRLTGQGGVGHEAR